MQLVQPLGKQYGVFLKKLNIDLPYDPAIPLLDIYPKESESVYSRSTCTPMFIAALFTIASYRNRQDASLLMNGLRKCGIYTQWNFTQPGRRMKSYNLQVNGWNWRTSSSERLARLRGQKSYVLPRMQTLDLGKMQQCCWTWVTC
jgi:hypothetical protein